MKLLFALFAALLPAFPQTLPDGPKPKTDDRLQYYLHRTYGWQGLTMAILDAGSDHALNEPRQWNRSPESLPYRYVSNLGKRVVRNTLQLGFEAWWDQDARYTRSREHGLHRRVWHAVSEAFLAHRADGSAVLPAGHLAANAVASVAVAAWYPGQWGACAFAENAAWGMQDTVSNNLLTEFGPDMLDVGKKVLHAFRHRAP